MIQIGGVYSVPSANGRAYFCKSIAIEMLRGVFRDTFQTIGQGSM